MEMKAMKFEIKDKSFLTAPAIFLLLLLALLVTWAVMEPAALRNAFDNDGRSPFELITLPFYAALIPLVWWKKPFTGSAWRKGVLCSAVTCVAFMAIVKELDLHLMALHAWFPETVDANGHVYGLLRKNGTPLTGTPCKMRVLTNPGTPLMMKAAVVVYFAGLFGVFAALLAYFARPLITGIFKLHPVAWSVSCLGASGVMVQVMDRLPAWVRHAQHAAKAKTVDSFSSFCTAFEEGGELMIAIFGLLAIWQAHRIYNGCKKQVEQGENE